MLSRRKSVKNIGILAVLIFSSFLSIQAQATKKNLLFIITDQQRYDALSIAGNTVLGTPNLDRLAKGGTYFKNAYTPMAVCGPTRASILTGHTVENHGVDSNSKTYDYYEEGLMTMPTFDEVLTEEGYHCEYYGKWHTLTSKADIYKNPVRTASNGKSVFGSGGQTHIFRDHLNEHEPERDLLIGEFYGGLSKRPYITNPLDKYHGMTAAEMEAQGLTHSQPDQHGELQVDTLNSMTAFQAQQTIEAIERLKDEQFSITCSFHFPHAPMLPIKPYSEMYPVEDMVPPTSISDNMLNSPYINSNGRNGNPEYADPEKIKYMISDYYALIKEIDEWVGKILDKLDEHGLSENTLVIFTSDHGEMLGAHGMREKNVFYEESAHIPLLIRFPGEIDSAVTVDGYVSLIDLFPTILDYLEIEERASDGKSLRGLIEGTDSEHGKYVVTEWVSATNPNYMIVKDGWKLFIPNSANSTVIDAMYDLNTDPHEMTNLLAERNNEQYYEKAEELRESLLEWLEKNNSKHYNGVKDRELIDPPYAAKAEVLVARGSTWKYLDDGSDQGSAWREVEFNDDAWKSGSAELGFGDEDEATTLQSGHITYYFRHSFNIDTLSHFKSPMYMDLLLDDGAVTYLNGVKLARSNLPSGEITATTLATSDIDGSSEYEFKGRLYTLDNLVEGTNVIAVEVHQSSADSPDLSFNLGLEATDNSITGISIGEQDIPQNFLLYEAYPNPFNPTTTIRYQLSKAGKVNLVVYNTRGREVTTLVNMHKSAGSHQVEFTAGDLSSGIYFYRIQIGAFTDTKKLILLK